MRSVLTTFLKLVLRVFFTRADVVGLEHVPTRGPVMFAVNHPNALMDPLCLFCLAPRPVSVLAKSTLFSLPILGSIVRALDSLPVYRRQDAAADPRKNRETFELARDLLNRGGGLAIFPEGVSHSDSAMRPLKTGAARIALGAAAMQAADAPTLKMIPSGLFYTAKDTLRSAVLLRFGPAIAVPRVQLGSDGEPPTEAVHALTDVLTAALNEQTVQHPEPSIIPLLGRAAALLAADASPPTHLATLMQRQQTLLAGYRDLLAQHPAALSAAMAAMRSYDAALTQLGVPAAAEILLLRAPLTAGRILRRLAWLPLALPGVVIHYPAYRLIGAVAVRRAAHEEDMVASLKVLAALVFFPLTWLFVAGLAALWHPWGFASCLLLPLTGYAALLWTEAWELGVLHARMRRARRLLEPQRNELLAHLHQLNERLVPVASSEASEP